MHIKQAWLFPDLENLRPPKLKFDSTMYASASEQKCGEALQKYVKNWRPIHGVTVQIDIGNHRAVDFRVGNTLVEFHPICVWREMESLSGTEKMIALYKTLSAEQKAMMREALCEELAQQYRKKRKMALEACPDKKLRACRLIVCFDEVQFYGRVLAPLATNTLPSPVEWVRRWKSSAH